MTLKTQCLNGDTVVIDGEAVVSVPRRTPKMIPTFDDWQATPAQWKGGAVALGNFDGVHRGHQALLARTGEQARALGAPLVALTFEPHPRRFFVPDTGPFRLTLPPAKVRLLGSTACRPCWRSASTRPSRHCRPTPSSTTCC